jgi:hypothetical protein
MLGEGSGVTRRVVVGVLVAVVVGLLIGIPTGIIETPWYTRMTPVLWWNYPVWALSSLLSGALAATYVRDPSVPVPATEGGKTFMGTTLSLVAVGCPICNKVVVLALGVSGALTWFAPIQPLLAVASLGLLAYALWARRRTTAVCRLRASAPDVAAPTTLV